MYKTSVSRTSRDLRRSNYHIILRTIYFSGPISRLDLSPMTQLSPATVTNVVADLLEDQIVMETGSLESDGGRPRTLLEVNPDFGTFIGVDIGETHIHVELFNFKLEVLSSIRRTLESDAASPEEYAAILIAAVDELLHHPTVIPEHVLGVGIGVPGVVEHNEGVSVLAPNWGWRQVPFLEMLTQKIPFPIILDNGAKAMTLAESLFGSGRGVADLAVLLIGTGIGAGIITDGSLYRGRINSAGEWGHTTLVLDGRKCRCGSQGCLEAYAGAPGIIERLRELDPHHPALAMSSQQEVLAAMLREAQQDDPATRQVFQETAHYMGAGIANLINLFNPEQIVLGGWAGLQMGPYLLSQIEVFLRRYALPEPLRVSRLVMSELGQDAICMGAASLALDQFLKDSPTIREKASA